MAPEPTPEERKLLPENTPNHTQNSPPEKKSRVDSTMNHQLVQPEEQQPSQVTTKAKPNPPTSLEPTSNCKPNPKMKTFIRGKRRTRKKGILKTNDIRSFFHSIGDRLTHRGTQLGEVQDERERIQATQDQQQIPGDPTGIEPSSNSDHHQTVDLKHCSLAQPLTRI